MKIDLIKSVSPFTFKIKVVRLIWSVLVWPMISHLPRLASPLRIAALRLFGAKIGRVCLIEKGVNVLMPWNLHLSDYVVIGRNVEIYNYGDVNISSTTVVSQYCYLCTGSHDYSHPHMPLIWKNINIGSECWIAAGVFIAPGVSIPDGVVVGARSVVSRSLQAEWSVYAGNPCVLIKRRTLKTCSE